MASGLYQEGIMSYLCYIVVKIVLEGTRNVQSRKT